MCDPWQVEASVASSVQRKVEDEISKALAMKNVHGMELKSEMRLLGDELPLDSLDLATVIVALQDETGKDPFVSGFVNFETIGELVDLFERD
jgi:acyl carrier protein